MTSSSRGRIASEKSKGPSGSPCLMPVQDLRTRTRRPCSEAGDSDEVVADKFNRLKVFYKEGMPHEGWEKYNTIIVKYEGQIVGRK